MSKVTFFQAKPSHCRNSSSVLGAGSFYVVSSTIIQMVSRGFSSREFAGRSSFQYKVCKSFWHHVCMKCAPPFSLQGFKVIYLHTVGLRTLKLLGLSSKVFTFDYLFARRSDFFNSLAVSLTEWPEYCKRCLSRSTNSVGLHFCEIIEKIEENNKKHEIRKPSKWAEKYGGKTTRKCTFGAKIKKCYTFFKF